MNTYLLPKKKAWTALLERPTQSPELLRSRCEEIFSEVTRNGDKALYEYTKKFDQTQINSLKVSQKTINGAGKQLSKPLKDAIKVAATNIRTFHQRQQQEKEIITTSPGVHCWRETRPIEKVGLYIPGGSAPLFSTVLMLAIPAGIAGCRHIVLCSPPPIHPAILYAAKLTGVTDVFTLGGIQAIAAMSTGTESVPKVDKIFGPGNQYVTAAKQLAQFQGVAIDMPAGPSEVLVIADKSANPDFVAADLLSQAEHGPDSQVILLTDDKKMSKAVAKAIDKQSSTLPREAIIREALHNSKAIVLPDIRTCIDFSNAYAPEHLILATRDPDTLIPHIQHAGSVFLGHYSCESAGDYASGTNHTLPTNGYARSYSGVSLDSFVKKITFQHLSAKGLKKLGPHIEIMAEAEQLMAHKAAVSIRLKKIKPS